MIGPVVSREPPASSFSSVQQEGGWCFGMADTLAAHGMKESDALAGQSGGREKGTLQDPVVPLSRHNTECTTDAPIISCKGNAKNGIIYA